MILRCAENRTAMVNQIAAYSVSNAPTIYGSFTDGNSFRNSAFFEKHPDALRIIIYEDDVEPCNALSSRCGNKKIAALYFKVQNLPRQFNSSTKSVFPLIYAKSTDAKRYGYNRILEPLVEDLKKLENGVKVYFGQEEYLMRGAIIVIAGDTLAVHELFGLLGPSANMFCRECTISRNEFHEHPVMNTYALRDEQWYKENLNRLRKKKITSTECGLKPAGCILNDLQEFHITKNHSFDTMHDLAEGVIPITIQLVLSRYYKNKKLGFTVDFINHRLATFNYGYRDRKNKPSSNITAQMLLQPKSHRMRQTASQYLLFLRAFPFLFNHKVPHDCPYMTLISCLINITRISFSPTVPDFLIAELEIGITMFYKMYFDLFKRRPNKLHHLYHYPDCIKEIGPLQQYDCRVFEAKNKNIKIQMNAAKKFKNVCLSLAKRQLFAQAISIAERPFKDCLTYQSGKMFLIKNMKSAPLLIFNSEDRCFSPKEMVFNGVQFRTNCVVSVKDTNLNGLPTFGEIREIVVIDDKAKILLILWETIDFDDVLQAYQVENTKQEMLVSLENIHSHTTFAFWKTYNNTPHYISKRIYNNDY